ncbi:hypothetical protein AVEN_9627-1 [Araneus ventricosus]|uniref:Uncharacterized protein n=1 Tax=Araneus ventricosus TaxID=182803 RepID=A0A4Y2EV42_ARAVE|nr:hypothetical protein AVEN_9627-1 [Araneus ventricosus]
MTSNPWTAFCTLAHNVNRQRPFGRQASFSQLGHAAPSSSMRRADSIRRGHHTRWHLTINGGLLTPQRLWKCCVSPEMKSLFRVTISRRLKLWAAASKG